LLHGAGEWAGVLLQHRADIRRCRLTARYRSVRIHRRHTGRRRL
jgi:hypothetical protein